MNKIFALLAILMMIAVASDSRAQGVVGSKGLVISACGTVPPGYSGPPYRATQDVTGVLCAESVCGVSPPTTYSPGSSYPVLVDTNGKLCTN